MEEWKNPPEEITETQQDIEGEWLLIFDDGHPTRPSRKKGYILQIKNGVLYFLEKHNQRYQIIPIQRIIRIEKTKDNGGKTWIQTE